MGGQPFRLNTNDVTVGRVSASNTGKWAFQAGGSPPNAVRINARTGEGCDNAALPLYFSRVTWSKWLYAQLPIYGWTARCRGMSMPRRSGSMNFDMTGVDYSFHPAPPLVELYRLGQ